MARAASVTQAAAMPNAGRMNRAMASPGMTYSRMAATVAFAMALGENGICKEKSAHYRGESTFHQCGGWAPASKRHSVHYKGDGFHLKTTIP